MTSIGLDPHQADPNRDLQGLQFIRANAALLVVVSHLFGTLGLPEYFDVEVANGVFSNGGVGVHMFFVLSGFIIVYVSLTETTLKPRLSTSDFLLKRFVRIVPFMWVVIAAYAIVRYVGAQEFTPGDYLRAVFLFPVGDVAPGVVWTLRHEALFYVVFAIAMLSRRRAPWVLYLWCAAGVIVWAWTAAGLPVPDSELFRFAFGKYNAFFGAGVAVGLACQRWRLGHRYRLGSPLLAWALIGVATALAFVAKGSLGLTAVLVAATLALFAGVVTPTSSSAFARAWEALGDASYSIYLTHAVVLSVIASAWTRVLGTDHYVPAVVAGIALSLVVGVAAHYLVEKPVIRGSRQLVRRLEGDRGAQRRRSRR